MKSIARRVDDVARFLFISGLMKWHVVDVDFVSVPAPAKHSACMLPSFTTSKPNDNDAARCISIEIPSRKSIKTDLPLAAPESSHFRCLAAAPARPSRSECTGRRERPAQALLRLFATVVTTVSMSGKRSFARTTADGFLLNEEGFARCAVDDGCKGCVRCGKETDGCWERKEGVS
jgi:hypothetical protein